VTGDDGSPAGRGPGEAAGAGPVAYQAGVVVEGLDPDPHLGGVVTTPDKIGLSHLTAAASAAAKLLSSALKVLACSAALESHRSMPVLEVEAQLATAGLGSRPAS
jgi:hypothetical protein